MRIDTKHDLGRLWCIEYGMNTDDWWDVIGFYDFTHIVFTDNTVFFTVADDLTDKDLWVRDTDTFLSEAEAQAECDRRNGEGK